MPATRLRTTKSSTGAAAAAVVADVAAVFLACGRASVFADLPLFVRAPLYFSIRPEQRVQALLFLLVGFIAMLASIVASVGPLQAGLLSNDWTSYVHTDASYGPGLHLVGPGKSFVLFPTNQV